MGAERKWWQGQATGDCIGDLPDEILCRVKPLMNLIFVCSLPFSLREEDHRRLRYGQGIDLTRRKFTEILNHLATGDVGVSGKSSTERTLSLFSRADLQLWGIDSRSIRPRISDRPPRSYRKMSRTTSFIQHSRAITAASTGIGWNLFNLAAAPVSSLTQAGITFGTYDKLADRWSLEVNLRDVILLVGLLTQ